MCIGGGMGAAGIFENSSPVAGWFIYFSATLRLLEGSNSVKWLEWFLLVELVVLVVIGEVVSLTSFVMLMIWVIRKKYRWLFRH
jgi:hypothetical protein